MMSFFVVGAHNQQAFYMFKCRKNLNKKTKGACSSPISMILPQSVNNIKKEFNDNDSRPLKLLLSVRNRSGRLERINLKMRSKKL